MPMPMPIPPFIAGCCPANAFPLKKLGGGAVEGLNISVCSFSIEAKKSTSAWLFDAGLVDAVLFAGVVDVDALASFAGSLAAVTPQAKA